MINMRYFCSMFENQERTEIDQLGEFALIEHLTAKFELEKEGVLVPLGDDAAVFKSDENTVYSTDMLVEGIHFDLSYVPLKHLGYKAAVVNISDIAAMNARCRYLSLNIAISNRFSAEALEEFYAGFSLACERYKVTLIGGDTSASQSGMVISVSAIGYVDETRIARRNSAKENDLLIVSGDLGGAFMGLQVLEREKAVFVDNPEIQPDLEGNDYILERQLKPEARVDIVEMLEEMDVIPTSMIDISDGLASECHHLAKQSEVGIAIYEEKIPIDPMTHSRARDFELDPTTCALNGGEDYELLFTVKQEDWNKIKGNPNMTAIGHVTDKNAGLQLITQSGNSHPIEAQGWNHFGSEE
jgi:thiamine-monophosphate kinase